MDSIYSRELATLQKLEKCQKIFIPALVLSIALIITGIVAHLNLGALNNFRKANAIAMWASGSVGLIVTLIVLIILRKEIIGTQKDLEHARRTELLNKLIEVDNNNNKSYSFQITLDQSYPVVLLTKEQIKNIKLHGKSFFFYMQIKDSGKYTIEDVNYCASVGLQDHATGSVLKSQTQVSCLPDQWRHIDYKPTS